MQQSRYKIKFINGDLEGRSFAVKDSGLVIGSSMNADIRSSEYGVAEEHITLLPQFDAGILLHNPGNGSVWVRNVPVSEGDDVQINPGDDVRIGKALSFVLENYSEQQPQGDMPDIDNSGEATVVAPSGNTEIPGEKNIPPESSFTRYASAEELAELRNANKSIARQRKLAMFIAVVVSAIIVALAYYISESRVENPVTWPGSASGNYDDGEFKIDLGNNGKFLIYYPNSPSMVAKPGDKSFEVLTAVGKIWTFHSILLLHQNK